MYLSLSLILPVLAGLLITGCSEMSPYTGELAINQPPVVELTNGPIEGDSVQYNIHFYWIGDDTDGEIDHYEVALVDGDPLGFDPADTVGSDKWLSTCSTDTLLVTTADEYDKVVKINESSYAVYDKFHTFFIRAVDDRGGVSETIYRSFNAWTLAPHIFITEPANVNPDGGLQMLSPLIRFEWYGKDPVDSPWNYQDVDSIRYFWVPFYSTIIRDLNLFPENFDRLWGDWISIDAPGDSGRSTILGDDEIIPTGRSYIFAVQAKDDAGAVSSVFDERTNVRAFMAMTPTGPILTVAEPYMGSWSFIGFDLDPVMVDVPPGFELNFSWTGDASNYGAIVSTYRYGWDVTDFNDPAQWATLPLPTLYVAAPKTFYSGSHTLFVETTDNLGVVTMCAIEVTVIPVLMDHDLLWVDDMPSRDFTQTLYAYPTESEHDEFWTDICMRVPSFVPSRDIYDVAKSAFRPPPIALAFRYKNLIWTYSPAMDQEQGCVWNSIIRYSWLRSFNFLPYYMEYGGHVWTTGLPQRVSGLGAVLPARLFPSDLECDLRDPYPTCDSQEGMQSMPYVDYCVTVIDQVDANIIPWMPFTRSRELDAIMYSYVDSNDPVTFMHPGLPKRLELWDVVTQPGMFFDPDVRGFHNVEIYNPEYWMEYRRKSQQECFHPMYRIRTMNSMSVLDHSTVAFWFTRHADVVTPGGLNVAAASVHFGVPLWFFDRAQVDSIADVIFEEWQILQ